ncbi:asparagine synthase (glutamine-hydrolyzing) [Alkalihalobacillus sp. AL-G]|uniref:asparagine synthase (glutamine-hydrolyzing) n=1 Tax=Alkalihalobacillus sp. AL-G TaxID=2926399 RepID=UPI002729ABCC|nr:asparagine synthase (glutamine-hydrolyzing) [Alkalihalobacillus sp. AL-G]WLD92667.1 asparagine synthase (glutamine-hydrolyzing) [Alkalihalobacillus sp. AL-G]
MCGFIGYMTDSENPIEQQEVDLLREMTNLITHRGPDDEGHFYDEFIRFGFRRLSIIDLEGGHQPLSYENERYWIIFNGEIYNYVELRETLIEAGYEFETHCDTEVILANYAKKGAESVKDLRGMFGFLIWDKEEKLLFGARDPFGIKPFFYLEEEGTLYCASEKKSILQIREKDEVDPESLHHYLTYQFVPEPRTMSEGIRKLSPGHYFIKRPGENMSIQSFWKPSFIAKVGPMDRTVEEIRTVLRDSVKVHMRSDVPVGSFLSGGIDSSAIVALAREFNPAIKTFTVGFEREGFSEIDVAVSTAAALNVENIHYIVHPEEFINELPKIVWHMDDPVADPAAVPLYFVAREASKHVTVVLSGEGADELFGGYTIYNEPNSLKGYQNLPFGLRKWLKQLSTIMPEGMKGKSFIERGSMTMEERYIGNAKMFTEDEKQSLLTDYHAEWNYMNVTKPLYENATDYEDVHKMQYVDMHTWLRGDILVKADKMTMANSLELRVPFLDKEVFRVASQIAPCSTVTNGTTKYALREAMKGIVPDSVLHRRKLGFPVPIRHWLKNEIYDWARSLIRQSPTDCYIDKTIILQMLEDHRNGKRDYSRKIWTVLVFMIWHQIYVEKIYDFQEVFRQSDASIKQAVTN